MKKNGGKRVLFTLAAGVLFFALAVRMDGTVSAAETGSFTVCLDPGHQGSWIDMSATEPDGPGSSEYKAKSTTGTVGNFTGVPEYELNLNIALQLEKELISRGYEVVMTRENNDTAISNSERATIAYTSGSDIFVRIHANSSTDESLAGALTMTMSAQNPYVGELYEESTRLADEILKAYCAGTGFRSLGNMTDDHMSGINWSRIPVTILEMGFMSNQQEDESMRDPEMQEKMVLGIADGIDAYFAGIKGETKGSFAESEKDLPEQEEKETSGKEEQETSKTEEKPELEAVTEEEESEGEEAPAGEPKHAYNRSPLLETDLLPDLIFPREENGEIWAIAFEDLTLEEEDPDMEAVEEYHASDALQSASVIKVFIMGAVYDRICYPSDPSREIHFEEAYEGQLRSLLEDMIRVSDNTAANTLIEILGEGDFKKGAQVVDEFCREHGYDQTHVGRRFLESEPTDDNYISAGDCRKILRDIYKKTLVSEEASEKMLDILKGQTRKNKIPSGLPDGFESANKTGEMPEGYGLGCIENDMAIVFSPAGDYILTVVSGELGGRNDQAIEVIGQISSRIADWYVKAHEAPQDPSGETTPVSGEDEIAH